MSAYVITEVVHTIDPKYVSWDAVIRFDGCPVNPSEAPMPTFEVGNMDTIIDKLNAGEFPRVKIKCRYQAGKFLNFIEEQCSFSRDGYGVVYIGWCTPTEPVASRFEVEDREFTAYSCRAFGSSDWYYTPFNA